jgi:hypothetical protein
VSRSLSTWDKRAALFALLPITVLPLVFQQSQQASRLHPQRSAAYAPASRLDDWSTHHVAYSQTGTMRALETARSDPRALFRWREVEQSTRSRGFVDPRSLAVFPWHPFPRRFPSHTDNLHQDWAIVLGSGTTAAGQFAAKFTFDTTAVPSCTNDFVVFPVNIKGSATQPNIVAFNNLYSGTAGSTGICDGRATPPGDTDVKTSATVLWSYNIQAINGPVPTSPVLSLDGTKVAFVESPTGTGSAAHFHVLAWKSGDGQNTNLQKTTAPKTITTFSATAPAAGSGLVTDFVLGTATDTRSSPFIDYFRDLAYVGNDAGILYRVKNVFCTTAGCGGAAPSLDLTWGTAGAVIVGAGSCSGAGAKAVLTAPVLDFVTGNVFVGCADGKVYGFNSSGAALAIPSITVGDGSATGALVESPVVDGVNGFIYLVAGTGAAPNGASAVLVQAKTDLSSPRIATVGPSGKFNLHAPAFNDPYFSSAVSTNWLIYVGAYDSAGGFPPRLFAATFDASRNMTTGAPANSVIIGGRSGEYAPLTEFDNAGNDLLFVGITVTPPDVGVMNINAFPTGPPGTLGSEGTGVSGMIVDNSSTAAQASSIYFGALAVNSAVKLTQVGFN